METGKRIDFLYQGKHITVFNQRCREWTHTYDYRTPPQATLSSAGCGVFAVCHCGQWLTGRCFSPEELADFSMANGGRGDDGTDRPALLRAMCAHGWAERFGFSCPQPELKNDREALRAHLLQGRGVALCNLRVGHIVALLDAREKEGETQVLALDSYSETLDERVAPSVREIVPESAIDAVSRNAQGAYLGERRQYALYWAVDDTVRDFNLLYTL